MRCNAHSIYDDCAHAIYRANPYAAVHLTACIAPYNAWIDTNIPAIALHMQIFTILIQSLDQALHVLMFLMLPPVGIILKTLQRLSHYGVHWMRTRHGLFHKLLQAPLTCLDMHTSITQANTVGAMAKCNFWSWSVTGGPASLLMCPCLQWHMLKYAWHMPLHKDLRNIMMKSQCQHFTVNSRDRASWCSRMANMYLRLD